MELSLIMGDSGPTSSSLGRVGAAGIASSARRMARKTLLEPGTPSFPTLKPSNAGHALRLAATAAMSWRLLVASLCRPKISDVLSALAKPQSAAQVRRVRQLLFVASG